MESIHQFKLLKERSKAASTQPESNPMVAMYDLEALAVLKSNNFNDVFNESLDEYSDNEQICRTMASIANASIHPSYIFCYFLFLN